MHQEQQTAIGKANRPALRLVKTNDLSREDWLTVRKNGIGSSDAAAAVGLNPYQSQLELWMIKTGRDGGMPKVDPNDESSPMYWGTTGYNSIRSLAARLNYYQAVSGNLLACMPLELRLRGKSTTQSHRSAIYYVDLAVREGNTLEATISEAKQNDERRKSVGYDQAALDTAAAHGFANGAFEDSEDEIAEVVAEFFPSNDDVSDISQQSAASNAQPSLKDKLDKKVSNDTGSKQ